MDQKIIPVHIAIIADGNRRWAKERKLPTFEGHRRGFENIKLLSRKAKDLGVKIMTYWVFSTENWKRAVEEVGYLMGLAEEVIEIQLQEAIIEHTRIIHIGRKDRLPDMLRKKIEKAEITKAYLHFIDWVISNGSSYTDWYSNTAPGYRNNNNIYTPTTNY